MRHRYTVPWLIGAITSLLVVSACQDATPPDPAISLGEEPPPPSETAAFRLTGGGRVDQRDHTGWEKNTPESHDFATFGFQARPSGSGSTEPSGNLTWVEHDPAAVGGGFTFHGTVTFFTTPTDETSSDPNCGRFGGTGTGRAHLRDGTTYENLDWVVDHACDKGEPGHGVDHIKITIAGGAYTRHGLLSGGNIQQHEL